MAIGLAQYALQPAKESLETRGVPVASLFHQLTEVAAEAGQQGMVALLMRTRLSNFSELDLELASGACPADSAMSIFQGVQQPLDRRQLDAH